MWVADAQVSQTLAAEDFKTLLNTVMRLNDEGMFLHVGPYIYQFVQVVVNYIFEYIFAVRIILVEGGQYLRPFQLFA